MSLTGALRNLRVKASGDMRRPLPASFWEPLRGAQILEVGGPSACFRAAGLLPVYAVASGVDGIQPMALSTWHELEPAVGNVIDGERRGDLYITDDLDLRPLPDSRYDAVISSHVIEHIANPLRALASWRRLSGPGRHLLMVAPHKSATFDHRRSVTTLEHMVADLERGVGEEDLTHLEEFLRLHDASRNIRGQDDPEFVAEVRDNLRTRLMHHHTFTTRSLLELLDHAGLEILAAEARLPHDIYVLGRWPAIGARPHNEELMRADIRSPFRIDRPGVSTAATSTAADR